jgi:hypothetical protein
LSRIGLVLLVATSVALTVLFILALWVLYVLFARCWVNVGECWFIPRY